MAVSAIALISPAVAEDVGSTMSPLTSDPGEAGAAIAKSQSLRTRFIIGLDADADFDVFSLSNPNRVVIEFPDVGVRLPAMDEKAVGVIKTFRAGLAAPGKMRVVIDVTEPVVVEEAKVSEFGKDKFRLALDIVPLEAALQVKTADAGKTSGKKAFPAPFGLGAATIQPPLPRPAETPSERAAKTFKPVIVLDPGHGGFDSGAVKLGTVEKEVVLAFGHVLRDALEKTGRYKIVMTRDDDTFIPLDERTRYAEKNRANLFIAIHADYAGGGSSARGATIYSLRDGVAKSLERSAKGTVAKAVLTADELDTVKRVGDVEEVKDILADLAERDVGVTHERTGMFAKAVIEEMSENTMMRTDPSQQAAFRVLKTAQFPSVLIELAYVTNKDDAANLKSDEWRQKVAQSIVTAIDNYFSHDRSRLPM